MNEQPRIAFFADSYLEVNGAAMTCRRLVDYARHRGFPMLCVYAGSETGLSADGSIRNLHLRRSSLSFSLDDELTYDPFFQRHARRVAREISDFRPDLIHITGLNDVSIIGAYLSWKLRIPMIGSWHTNLHQFAAQRLSRSLRLLPLRFVDWLSSFAEKKILDGAMLYYRMPRINLAPNPELVDLLHSRTGRPARLMARGVDTETFSPEYRTLHDGMFRFGYAGRLRPEKNVRSLIALEKTLIAAGKTNFEFLIVGDGDERKFLEGNMQNAKFTGRISGPELSKAYANMDVFVFPSETETFGNVTLEANASGVPAIVSSIGGSKFLIASGRNGFVAKDLTEISHRSIELLEDRQKLDKMRETAREHAKRYSWGSIFEGVYDSYAECLRLADHGKSEIRSELIA